MSARNCSSESLALRRGWLTLPPGSSSLIAAHGTCSCCPRSPQTPTVRSVAAEKSSRTDVSNSRSSTHLQCTASQGGVSIGQGICCSAPALSALLAVKAGGISIALAHLLRQSSQKRLRLAGFILPPAAAVAAVSAQRDGNHAPNTPMPSLQYFILSLAYAGACPLFCSMRAPLWRFPDQARTRGGRAGGAAARGPQPPTRG